MEVSFMPPTPESLNAELSNKYRLALSAWSAFARSHDLSQPQLMVIPQSYMDSEIRLMIVGQESGGWGDPAWDASSDEGRALLLSDYTGFNLALGNRSHGTPFWQASYRIRDLLNPKGAPNSFLWSNLVPVSEKQGNGKFGHPSDEVAKTATALRLLQTEMEVARPDVVVFFTGVSHDPLLRSAFPEAQIVDLGEGIAEVKGLPAGSVAYRCEHPLTLQTSKRLSVLDRVATLARDSIKGRKS
jgi:hypothetical protein